MGSAELRRLFESVRIPEKGPFRQLPKLVAAAGDKFAQNVPLAEPCAAVVKGDVRWVIGHAAAGTQADCVGLGALKVVEPELKVPLARLMLHKRKLSPAHWPVHPTRCPHRWG